MSKSKLPKPYYDEDGITIYHGDCRELLPFMPEVDLVLTDPPYGEETHSGARTSGAAGELSEALVDFPPLTASVVRDVFAACQTSRWLISFIEWRHLALLERCPPAGLRFVRFGVWVKPNGAPQMSGDRPATGWEAVGIFHREGGRMKWNGGGHHAVWEEPKVNGEHPTTKPTKLVRRLVQLFSNPGDLILDPFMGSGTTLRAAKDLGRKAIGIEIEERYCEIAAKRMRAQALPLDYAPKRKKRKATETLFDA